MSAKASRTSIKTQATMVAWDKMGTPQLHVVLYVLKYASVNSAGFVSALFGTADKLTAMPHASVFSSY